MGFLIDVSHESVHRQNFAGAVEVCRSWSRHPGQTPIEVRDRQLRITCLPDEGTHASYVWRESIVGKASGSFVYIIGWCYRIGSAEQGPTPDDCRGMLERERAGLPPITDDFSGNYAVVVYDDAGRRIAVQPDRWALTAIYFTVSGTGIAISNRSSAVASLVGAGVDGDSLLSLMRGAHMPFGRSLFSRVSRVMCGCYLNVDVEAVDLDHARVWPLYVSTYDMTFQDATTLLEETATTVASRLLGSTTTLFDLTGGNDTRLMAAAVAHEGAGSLEGKAAWRVAGPLELRDVEIAAKIARLFDWQLIRLDTSLPADATGQELAKAAAYVDGTSLVDGALKRIRQEVGLEGQWDWLVGSIGGELLRGFFWRHEMLSLNRPDDVDYAALLAYRLYAARGVDTRWFGEGAPSLEDHDEALLAPYRQIGEVGRGRLKPYKLDVMYVHKLCYGAGNTQSWLLGLQSARVALLSWEWTRMALAIPWRFRSGRSLVLHAIQRLSPKLTDIPNDKGEPMAPLGLKSLPHHAKAGLVSSARLAPRVLRRYTGLLGARNGARVPAPPAAWVALVRDARYLRDIVDSAHVKDLCRDVTSPEATSEQVRVLYTLLTMELLLQQVPNLSRKVDFTSGPAILH